MLRLVAIFIFLVVSSIGLAQDPMIMLNVDTKDDDNGKKLGGVTVEVYKDGKLFVSKVSAANGKVPPIELPVKEGSQYTVYLKKDGYVTKMANIDAHYDYPEDLDPLIYWEFQTALFQKIDGVDFSFLETTPMVKFEMDDGGFQTYDKKYTENMLNKIEELKKQIAEKKEEDAKKEADFSAYVKAGDAAVVKTDYKTAIGQYDLALAIKDDPAVKAKKEEAQKKLDELNANAALEKEFGAKMEAAKKAYEANNLTEALKLYKEASSLKPLEKLPKDRISEIETTLANEKANEEKFKNLVAAGDAAVGKESYDEGIAKYEEALKIKSDPAVQTKLDNAKKAKADKEGAAAAAKKLDEDYANLMAEADKAFNTDDLETAKTKYNAALALKPTEAQPKEQIKKIDALIQKRLDEKNAAEKLEADYKKLIDNANELFAKKDWENAKLTYEKALDLKKNEKYPLDQINIINKNIADDQANAAVNEKYNAAMAEAKVLFDQKKYTEALSKYQEASGIKTQEQEPKTQIQKIQTLLADQEKSEKLEADYTNFMKEGKDLKGIKDYTAAIDRFNKALALKPGDAEANAQIKEINEIIEKEKAAAAKEAEFADLVKKGDEKFNAKDYSSAKLSYQKALEIKADPALTAKIADIDKLLAEQSSAAEIQAKYDAKIKEASTLYKSNDYRAALEKYEEAAAIKPNEQEPKDKIGELKDKIAAEDAAKSEKEKFDKLVAEADAFFANKDYSNALTKYKEAIKVKPDPAISAKIGQINTLITEQNQNQEKDELYNKKMSEADVAFAAKNWETARSLYREAIDMKPNEQKPKDQIALIEKNMQAESDAETEKNYQKIITKADQLFDEDNLDEAITYYQRALSIKPTDPYPTDKISQINRIKKERADASQNAAKFEEDYKALMKKADEAFNAQNYQSSLSSFKEALLKKPNDPYPKSKISEIEGLLAKADEQRKIDEDYKAKIAEADALFNSGEYQASIAVYTDAQNIKLSETYPKNQILKAQEFMKQASVGEIEQQYQKILEKAKEKFDAQNYSGALDLYMRAKTMKPTDPIPQQRIDEINQILAREADEKRKKEEYDALIKKADADYERKEWKTAKANYTAAYNLINDQYPLDQIAKIDQAMKGETGVEIESEYKKIIEKADEYFVAQNWEKAKSLYQRALKLKSYDQYPKDQLAEIERILNPPIELTAGYTLTDYGPPNRNTNSVDVEKLLEDANDERQFAYSEAALDQRIEAAEADGENNTNQVNATFKSNDAVEEMEVLIEERVWDAEVHRTEYEQKVVVIEDNLDERDRAWSKMNENDMQHTKQAVGNLENEIRDNNADNDQPRDEYLVDVERIQIEIRNYNSLNSNEQVNEAMDARTYVEDYLEDNITTDPSLDIERKNTEVYVEDLNITLINAHNENVWNQEDEVIKAKNQTEILVDEQIASTIGKDNKRVESLVDVEDLSTELYNRDKGFAADQYDETIDVKNFTEDLTTEITNNNLNSDQPRIDMEETVVDISEELLVTNDNYQNDQVNELYKTDGKLENLEIEMDQNKLNSDKPREDYEVSVVDLSEDIIETNAQQNNNGVSATNATEDLATKLIDDQNAHNLEADSKALDNQEKTTQAVEAIIEENNENLEQNNVAVEKAEDYLEELKYEDPNKAKEIGTNKLGEDFPEGITEDIFTIKGEDGLVSSYVVRRIVVINGFGVVYEKTKTRYGTETYTKNGAGISETTWQDETESADLVRN